MYLLIGHSEDACCRAVSAAFEARGARAEIIANPMIHPWRVSWRFGDAPPRARFGQEQELELEGVLVRGRGEISGGQWQPGDLLYMQSEMQSALLGWLWALSCPVVNRPPAWLWHRPQVSLVFWQPLLWRSGLRAAEMMVGNVESDARAFGARHAGKAVYAPLTADERYLIEEEEDWSGLAAMQSVAPVALRQSLDDARLACIVGGRVVWDAQPPADRQVIEPRLTGFAAAIGLDFLQMVLARGGGDWRVVAVEPHPRFEQFGIVAQQAIAESLACLLVGANRESMQRSSIRCAANKLKPGLHLPQKRRA